MEQELILTVPTSMSEITLGQFINILKGNAAKALNISDESLKLIPADVLSKASEMMGNMYLIPSVLADHFVVDGVKYVVNLKVDEITLDEKIIYDSIEKDIKNLHKIIALHTRPAMRKSSIGLEGIKKRGFWNTVKHFRKQQGPFIAKDWSKKEYVERCKLFYEKMPADLAYSICLLYGEFGVRLAKAAGIKLVNEILEKGTIYSNSGE